MIPKTINNPRLTAEEERMTPDNTYAPELEPIASSDSIGNLNGFLDSPEFQAALQNEFPEDAAEWADPVSRRRFLGLMGASIALAGATGCNLRPAPERKILPYTTQPDEITPGVPLFFATAAPLCGYGTGILVRSHEGRPIKVEGNPSHPSSLGGVGVYAQATVLDLYDPDRSRGPTHKGVPTSYQLAVAALRKELYGSNASTLQPEAKAAKQLRIVTETVTSPTLAYHIGELLKAFPNAKWIQHDPVSRENFRAGIQKAFGQPLNITYDFSKADVILSLDADFLCSGPGHVRYSRDFAGRRKVRRATEDGIVADKMNRLYAVECMPTNTGASADHRLALNSSQIESFARELARELGVTGVPAAGSLPESAKSWIRPLAEDLKKTERKGKTVVLAGDHLPASLHVLAFAINSALGNIGQTVIQSPAIEARPPEGKASDLKTLTAEMAETTEKNKKVEVLLIFSSNPAYTTPADVPFASACKNVPFKLHLGTHQDETAVLCEWHIPEAHYLETWGDIKGHDGTSSIQQPLIAPIYHGKSIVEFLADLVQGPFREGLDIVKKYWREQFTEKKFGGEFEIFWQNSVRSGVVAEPASPPNSFPLSANWTSGSTPPATPPAEGQFELNFRPDPTLFDGRYANNGWLQELPKPMTLLTWDNAAFVSPATAEKLGVHTSFRWTGGEHGRAEVCVIELTVKILGKDTTIKAPVWKLPGHADGAVTVHLGSGRTRAGRVGNQTHEPNAENQPVRGFNAYAIRSVDGLGYATGLTLKKTSKKYFLACVQGRWSTIQVDPTSGEEMDRMPVRRGTIDTYKKNPAFAKIPPMAAGETELIDKNVPAPNEVKKEHAKKEGEKKEGEKHEHDERLIPLTMYNPVEVLAPDVPEGQRRRWGMAIDLSACTGCSSCVIACQSENNSPVVGKEQVTRGRAMHWISIDRYYGGHQEKPNADVTSFQPRMCVQCENAPCEIVCPVGATVHSADGLNDMAYNRCVGTRYCSNNCPYKVRRFNFLTYADWSTDTLKLGRNPDVTVRSRGVMEKCTFCVQRIRGAEIVAEREGREIHDGEILTACQSACPSGAIVFGDLNDSKSVVARWKNEPANYGLLAELNTRPRLTHLANLRNPNEKMPKGA
jgi:MoCo/4Fe-4S cofactor protein with predicted Tat translocation signal